MHHLHDHQVDLTGIVACGSVLPGEPPNSLQTLRGLGKRGGEAVFSGMTAQEDFSWPGLMEAPERRLILETCIE